MHKQKKILPIWLRCAQISFYDAEGASILLNCKLHFFASDFFLSAIKLPSLTKFIFLIGIELKSRLKYSLDSLLIFNCTVFLNRIKGLQSADRATHILCWFEGINSPPVSSLESSRFLSRKQLSRERILFETDLSFTDWLPRTSANYYCVYCRDANLCLHSSRSLDTRVHILCKYPESLKSVRNGETITRISNYTRHSDRYDTIPSEGVDTSFWLHLFTASRLTFPRWATPARGKQTFLHNVSHRLFWFIISLSS